MVGGEQDHCGQHIGRFTDQCSASTEICPLQAEDGGVLGRMPDKTLAGKLWGGAVRVLVVNKTLAGTAG